MDKFFKALIQRKVIANILILVFVLGGLVSAQSIRQEFLPDRESRSVQVSVEFIGAQPDEIETSILMPIENAVRGIDGIKKVMAQANENQGDVTLTMLDGINKQELLSDVKNAIDRIETFPEAAEEPVVKIPSEIEKVISLMVYGDQPDLWLRKNAENIRDDLLSDVGLTKVQLAFPRPQEVSVEVREEILRAYNLSIDEIAQKIQENAIDLPGGTIYTPQTDLTLRTNERREWAEDFADIIITQTEDGLPVKLSDLAELSDGFGTSPIQSWYNGKPAIQIDIFAVGGETPISVEKDVKAYLSEVASQKYAGIAIEIFENDAQAYRERMTLLIDNAMLGLVMVMIVLALFLTPRLAFWVMMGIPTSLLGGMILLPFFDASINMISLFAFIVTIGVVVDDAIMVGEAIHTRRAQGMKRLDAALQGLKDMGVPILLAVSTTIIAFMPMFFIPGPMGTLFKQIPAVVVAVLLVSIIECLFILVAHLAEDKPEHPWLKTLSKPQQKVNAWLENFTHTKFRNFIRYNLIHPAGLILAAFSTLALSVAAIMTGMIGFSFTPSIQLDTIIAQTRLPYGSPKDQAIAIQSDLVQTAQEVLKESGMESPGIFSIIGARLDGREVETDEAGGTHNASAILLMPPTQKRSLTSQEVAKAWQDKFGNPGGLEAISFIGEASITGGEALQLDVYHPDKDIARQAAITLGERMAKIGGLSSINDGLRSGKPEIKLTLKEQGVLMGLSANDVARQIRNRFYGAEAIKFARDGNDIKVMVRLDAAQRRSQNELQEIVLKSPQGALVPLGQIANFEEGNSATALIRRDGRRIYPVTAEIMVGVNDDEVEDQLDEVVIPKLLQDVPGLEITYGGEEEDTDESLAALGQGFLVVLAVIYVLLAFQFNSYIQPLMVMSAIPFSLVGALWGHIMLGFDLSIISVIGIIAMTGVIINDSLVLVTAYNQYLQQGFAHRRAILQAACRRLRPILLTTLTTFFGLFPMMLETSEQAQFLIPMAVSISFGLMFGTFIVLGLLPVLLGLVKPQKL